MDAFPFDRSKEMSGGGGGNKALPYSTPPGYQRGRVYRAQVSMLALALEVALAVARELAFALAVAIVLVTFAVAPSKEISVCFFHFLFIRILSRDLCMHS
ncbi:hypothetical protein POVWA2_003880 [Plasmodium ovale wallikeri]|uniref:Uncharacterized protein n=1 Tax=Plasmodium ovale wallikeri TaxID=864142 RepID=A0A1A8YIM3_PLAOA|nr:hypothetical protein POVWA1_003740 [Plasmodium ovale wallikeri]SBT31388.1 hypothetical protein POVWA2_003880 [Plasmodium ovale wallikeri]